MSLAGMHTEDLHRGILLFEKAPSAGNGAACAQTRDEMRDLPFRLSPDLRHVEPGTLGNLHRLGDRAFGRPGRRAQRVVELDHLGAEEPEHGALLERYLKRQRRGQRVALRVRDHGEGHAGVP